MPAQGGLSSLVGYSRMMRSITAAISGLTVNLGGGAGYFETYAQSRGLVVRALSVCRTQHQYMNSAKSM